jgi:hypothetical protein
MHKSLSLSLSLSLDFCITAFLLLLNNVLLDPLTFQFCIIDFETSLSTTTLHLPVEIGIFIFNFKVGKVRTFHRFIDAGLVPNW